MKRFSLKPSFLFSLLIAILTGIASIAGLLYPETLYASHAVRQSSVANDVITLLVGLPILFITMWLAWRGKLVGLLLWPGALLYGLYNYTAYLFSTPFAGMFPLYLLIVTLSLYTIIMLVASIDAAAVKQQLAGNVPERLAGGVLAFMGIAFAILAMSTLIGASFDQNRQPASELAVFVADFLVTGAWIIGGLLLWRKQPLGYVGGAGLLFNATMLFIGIIGIVILQAIMNELPFPLADVLTLLVMGSICIIPFILFVRGVLELQVAIGPESESP